MVFPPDKHESTAININGCTINEVSSCRYLGLMIDDELKWTVHINHVYKSIIKFTNIFYKLRTFVPNKDVLKDLILCFCISTFALWC